MSIQERKAYGEALALIQRHGMVAVTEERMKKLLVAVECLRLVTRNSHRIDFSQRTIFQEHYEQCIDVISALEDS